MRRTHSLLLVIGLLILSACAPVVPVPVVLPDSSLPAQGTVPPATTEDASTVTVAPVSETSAGAPTPEEAVEAYMQGIVEGNLQAVFDAAARRDIARKFAFVRSVQRLRALPIYQALLPPNDDFAADLNQARAEEQISSQVMTLAWTLLAGKMVNTATGITAPVDDQWATQVAALMDMSRLQDIELTEIAPPNPELMASDSYQKNAQEIADVYGADEYTERVAHFTFEGQEYLVGFQLLRYGDSWYVLSQTSPLAGTSASGAPVEVDN